MELMVSVICDVAFELQKSLHSIYNSNQLDLHPCLSSSNISLQMSLNTELPIFSIFICATFGKWREG